MDISSNENPNLQILPKEAICQNCNVSESDVSGNIERSAGEWLCKGCRYAVLVKTVVISYTNYKGISSVRKIIPKEIYFGSNQWHKKPQWLLKAFDLDKNAERNFAMADIHSWQ